jgi:kynurenine formamidase
VRYPDLLARTDAPAGSSWGHFGDLGTIARLTNRHVVDAAACIRDGASFNLDWPVNAFDPPTSTWRGRARHHMFWPKPDQLDDYLDNYYLQGTSQIDALRHVRHPDHGFYNHVPDDSVYEHGGRLGVEQWAERGIIGRGVLVDLDRHLQQARGHGLDHEAGEPFPVSLLDEAAESQGVAFRDGDILLIRTGWSKYYFDEMTEAGRAEMPRNARSPGLLQEAATLAWLWDRKISLVAADNVAVENLPILTESPLFTSEPTGKLHPYLVALLGLALGELWNFEDLACACHEDSRYEAFVCAKPLYMPGGVGSPANAVAIR